jgi:hypothetical protein
VSHPVPGELLSGALREAFLTLRLLGRVLVDGSTRAGRIARRRVFFSLFVLYALPPELNPPATIRQHPCATQPSSPLASSLTTAGP